MRSLVPETAVTQGFSLPGIGGLADLICGARAAIPPPYSTSGYDTDEEDAIKEANTKVRAAL